MQSKPNSSPILHTALFATAVAAVAIGVQLSVERSRTLYFFQWCGPFVTAQTLYLLFLSFWSAESLARRWLWYGVPMLVLAGLEGGIFLMVNLPHERLLGVACAFVRLVPLGLLLWLVRVACRIRIGPPDAERSLSLRDLFGVIALTAVMFGVAQAVAAHFNRDMWAIFGWRLDRLEVTQDARRALTAAAVAVLVFRTPVAISVPAIAAVAVVSHTAEMAVYLGEGLLLSDFKVLFWNRANIFTSVVLVATFAGYFAYLRLRGCRLLFGRGP